MLSHEVSLQLFAPFAVIIGSFPSIPISAGHAIETSSGGNFDTPRLTI